MKTVLTFLFFVLSFANLHAQSNESTDFEAPPASVNEVIRSLGADTLVFYYNDRYQLVKPFCGTIFRVSRMDTVLLTFTGKFVDFYAHDTTTAIEGAYANGKKEGRFQFYYPNGQVEQFGNYADDRKTGIWEYFYEDGTQRQVLDFREDEILIKEFWNEEGKKMVEGGNGSWHTYESAEKFIKTSGEVLNGRKNGTWNNTIASRNFTTNTEKYKEGNLVSGKMFSIAGGTDSYKNKQYCSIEKDLTFLAVEQFQMNSCYKIQKNNWEFATYPGGMDRFNGEIRKKIGLNRTTLSRGVIKVQTTIDTTGKMTNFKPVSNTSNEVALIEVLQTMDNWTPTKVNGKAVIQPKIISIEIR